MSLGMEATLMVIIILLAVALIVLLVQLAPRRSARQAADQSQRDLEWLRTSVDRLEERVRDQLAPQIGSVGTIAEDLRRTLYSPNRRGQWAEQSLASTLEDSGLREGHDYRLQHTIRDGDSKLRPDAVVFMPKGIKVVIDSKAVWDSYEKAQSTLTDEEATPYLEHHADTLLARAQELGERDYSNVVGGSPRFVLMFVPADPIVDTAMKVRPTLWEQAWRRHGVLIATPGTLMAFLRTVVLAWQEHEISESAHQIADLGKELYARLNTFAGHLKEMGESLDKARAAYNSGVGSLKSRVLPQARRFRELGAVARTEQLVKPELVQDPVRRDVAPES